MKISKKLPEIFQAYFHRVISTDNGDEALKLYKTNEIDVAILDVNINGLDGISVVSKIKETSSEEDLIILMISAYSDREKLMRAINLHLFAYPLKPVENKKLFSSLDDIIKLLSKKSIIDLSKEYRWNVTTKQLLYTKEELQLTKNESLAIQTLIEKKNFYTSACEIHYETFKEKAISNNNCNNIVQLLSRLKKKMDELHKSADYFIENCYGMGYRITI